MYIVLTKDDLPGRLSLASVQLSIPDEEWLDAADRFEALALRLRNAALPLDEEAVKP